MHSLIIGMTESGKTTLAKMLCTKLRKAKKRCFVLDPLLDPEWDAEFITKNSGEFINRVKRERNLYLFVDESSEAIGRYNTEMQWLATQSRHWGHSCFFITQGVTQIAPIIRSNTSRVYAFACGESSTKLLAEEYRKKELAELEHIGKGEFYIVERFAPMRRGKINFQKRVLTLDKPGKVA